MIVGPIVEKHWQRLLDEGYEQLAAELLIYRAVDCVRIARWYGLKEKETRQWYLSEVLLTEAEVRAHLSGIMAQANQAGHYRAERSDGDELVLGSPDCALLAPVLLDWLQTITPLSDDVIKPEGAE